MADGKQSQEVQEEDEILLPSLRTYIDSTVVEQREVITAEEIAQSHAENLTELLKSSGMQILAYGPYGLEQKPSIRGFTDETVRVVIDGLCVNNAQYGTFDFSSISADQIEKVEIVRGGFTEGVSDEGAVAGVIYITTKKQSLGQHFSADSSIKSFLNANYPLDTFSQSLGYNGQLGDSSFLKIGGRFTYASNKYPYINKQKIILQRENCGVIDGQGNASFSRYFGNGNSFTIGDLFYAGKKNTPGPATGNSHGLQQDYDNNLTLNITLPAIKNSLRFTNSFAWLCNNRFYEDMAGKSEHYVNTWKYSAEADFYRFEHFKQSAGITFDGVYLNSTDDGIHVQISGTFKETSKVKINDIFSFSIPMAVKFCNQNVEFIPKLGFRCDLPVVDVLLCGYRMVQFPNMDDLYWNGFGMHGNPELKAENGWGGELTFNVHDVWIPFSLCGFVNYYENKIQWAGLSPQNVASAFYAGINFSTEKSFFNEHLLLKGNVEYLYNALLNKKNYGTYGKRIMWTPDLVASGSIKINFWGIFLTVEGNYMGKRYVSNLNIDYMDPYFLLNACLEIKKTAWFVPYIRADNLLNWQYESVENYPMPGFSLTLGIHSSF